MMTSKQRDVISFFENLEVATASKITSAYQKRSLIPRKYQVAESEDPTTESRKVVRKDFPPGIGRFFQGELFSIFKEEHANEAALRKRSLIPPKYQVAESEDPTTESRKVVRKDFPPGIGRLDQGEHFSIFKEEHANEAALVYNFLLSKVDYEDFKEQVKKLREILNEGLYIYAISVAWMHHEDTVGTFLPPVYQIHPRRFFANTAICHSQRDDGSQSPPLFTTGTVRDKEFKLAWWREDVMLNSHHYHWHKVYPYKGIAGKLKDREGELFYYMHQQMLARYDAERLGVGLMRVEPFTDWSSPIPEGYNSHLTDYYGANQYAARPANMTLADKRSDPDNPTLVSEQEYHYYRLLDAIHAGKFEKDSNYKEDDCTVTIDRLGAAVEASIASPNKALYGDLHNTGHDLLASITDPDDRYLTVGGVMGDNATAIRDPIFFRWHKFIDNIFVQHKLTLDPYEDSELALQGFKIWSVFVKGSGENVLTTCMKDVKIDISKDMFLDQDKTHPNTPTEVKVRQLDHKQFEYRIDYHSTKAMKVAFRIFMAPTYDEFGVCQNLSHQRRMFIEMDKFVQEVQKGTNNISRSSTASSVVKPIDLTYDQLEKRTVSKEGEGDCTCLADRYCECGWPENMLLPRGTESGMQFDLFVMATDWSSDSTDNLDKGTSYCGLRNEKYPDRRSMGFPFDRKMGVYCTINEFAEEFSNMFTTQIKIKHVRRAEE